MGGEPLDGTAFAGGIPALKTQDYRDPLAVQLALEHLKPVLQLLQLFFVFLPGIG